MSWIKNEINYLRLYFLNRKNYSNNFGRAVPFLHTSVWYFPWRSSLKAGRSPVADRVPWVVFGAKEYISRSIKQGSKVFEYGMGGSTLFFLDSGCTVISVEHNSEWGDKLSSTIGKNSNWTGIVVPPSKTLADTSSIRYSSKFPGYENFDFREYVEVIQNYNDKSLDLVMVDGRARSAAIQLAASKVIPGGLIVLDNAERPRYAEAINFLFTQGWKLTRCFGPGPYVAHEFWDTLLLEKPHFGNTKA